MLIFSNILQVLVLGQPGEEVSLELILRVVADVGLVVSLAYFLFRFMHVCIMVFLWIRVFLVMLFLFEVMILKV